LVAVALFMSAWLFGIELPLTAREASDGQTISVQFNGPSDIPLEIANAVAISAPSGLQSLKYDLVNRGDTRLLAVQITWRLHFANGSAPRTDERMDFAFGFEDKLLPGSSESMEVGSFEGTRGYPVQSVTGEITFAQFADGKTLGSEQDKVLPWLKDERLTVWSEYRPLIEVYRNGGEAALAQALAAPESESETARGKALRKSLLRLRQQNGIAAAETQLKRVASLKLPE
jgi:hypothetical protein